MSILRAVKVFQWTKDENEKWVKTERCFGVFHGFGIDSDDREEKISAAIVEFDDGSVELVPPTFIEFLSPKIVVFPEDDEVEES